MSPDFFVEATSFLGESAIGLTVAGFAALSKGFFVVSYNILVLGTTNLAVVSCTHRMCEAISRVAAQTSNLVMGRNFKFFISTNRR